MLKKKQTYDSSVLLQFTGNRIQAENMTAPF